MVGRTGAGGPRRGGWFDTLGTSPQSYVEQARQTILGGATESMLFEAGALMGLDGPSGRGYVLLFTETVQTKILKIAQQTAEPP